MFVKKEKLVSYGVWGNMRAEFLKTKHPQIYYSMANNNELASYLQGYQEAYSQKASELSTELERRYKIDDDLRNRSVAQWCTAQWRVHCEVRETLKKEIQS